MSAPHSKGAYMLRIYRSPDGYTFQYEEGTQPEGYELVEQKAAKPSNKAKKPANKAKKAKAKDAD